MTQEETKDGENLLSKPYLDETRVEYKSVIPMDLPPGLDLGRGDRTLGLGDKLEPKTTMKIDPKLERDTDAIMTEKEGTEKLPKTEKGPTQWEPTERGPIKNGVTSRIPKTVMGRIIGKQHRRRHEIRVVSQKGESKSNR